VRPGKCLPALWTSSDAGQTPVVTRGDLQVLSGHADADPTPGHTRGNTVADSFRQPIQEKSSPIEGRTRVGHFNRAVHIVFSLRTGGVPNLARTRAMYLGHRRLYTATKRTRRG